MRVDGISCCALAAVWLAAAAQAAGQLPGQTAPAGRAPAQRPARPQELPPPYVTRQSDVEIPFSVKPGDTPDTQPTAVRVFVSWDHGKTWHFYDERSPRTAAFASSRGRTASSGSPRRPSIAAARPTAPSPAAAIAAGDRHAKAAALGPGERRPGRAR